MPFKISFTGQKSPLNNTYSTKDDAENAIIAIEEMVAAFGGNLYQFLEVVEVAA